MIGRICVLATHIILFLFFNVSLSASDIQSLPIVEINIKENIQPLHLYTGSDGNRYVFLDEYYVIEHNEGTNDYVQNNQKEFIIVNTTDYQKNRLSSQLIHLENSIIDLACLEYSNVNNGEYLKYHPGLKKIPQHPQNTIFINASREKIFCLADNTYYYFPKSDTDREDILSLFRFINEIDAFVSETKKESKSQMDTLKNIYRYVIENGTYDYVALAELENYGNNDDPRKIVSLFKNIPVVCDGYVKTFVFLSRVLGVHTVREVGKLHPIDLEENLANTFHSRVKYEDYYFDPTFEDTSNVNNAEFHPSDKDDRMYFGVGEKCFQLEHTKPGRPIFHSSQERLFFILTNLTHLKKNCSSLVKKIIISDNTARDFVHFVTLLHDPDNTIHVFCTVLELCLDRLSTSSQILDALEKITLRVEGKRSVVSFTNLQDFQKSSYHFVLPLNVKKYLDSLPAATKKEISYALLKKRKFDLLPPANRALYESIIINLRVS